MPCCLRQARALRDPNRLRSPGASLYASLTGAGKERLRFLRTPSCSGPPSPCLPFFPLPPGSALNRPSAQLSITETLKRIVEIGGQADAALAFLREEDRIGMRKRKAAFKIAGLVNIGLCLGLMLFLHGMVHNSTYLVGTIPLFIGIALLIYVYLLSPQDSGNPDHH